MNDEPRLVRKEFPNGDMALDDGNGLVYHTPDARYTVELVPPGTPLSDEPFGVDLVRTTRSEHGLQREQRLTLAEYRSYMAAEEHVREVEGTLLEQGRAGLESDVALVNAMPYEPDDAVYMVGLYPFDPDRDRGTLSLIRVDGRQLDVAAVARGSIADLAPIEQRLWDVKVEGDPGRLLNAAALEAVRAHELAPGAPLFVFEGEEVTVDRAISSGAEPRLSGWDQPSTPATAAQTLPVTFDPEMVPFDPQGRYVPHCRDEAGVVHFFAVVPRPPDSPTPDDTAHELRYFRAQKTDEDRVIHDSQPVMPVEGSDPSPWPLPALQLHLEEGELETVQALARDTALIFDLSAPDRLPALDREELERPGWYHFDAALVCADPQGVDDGYSVGVVDVYAHHATGEWAARYLPMGEFDTLDEALAYQEETLHNRLVEDRASALSPDGFNRSPAIFERIALAETDAALADLLERHDGHYPPDYDGTHEPEWEALTSKEWEAYQDHLRIVAESAPGTAPIRDRLPGATPGFASYDLVTTSEQPDAPYLEPGDFKLQDVAPTWRLDIVPAVDPGGGPLGYSAVCVVDFSELAEAASPDTPERAQWLEVAQFQTEDRARQFREDFMSLVEADELGNITGPALAGVIADDLEMDSQWQIMDKAGLEKLNSGEWGVSHPAMAWRPLPDQVSPDHEVGAANLDIDL